MIGTYERTSQRLLRNCTVRPARMCVFIDGKLLVGYKSGHRSKWGRIYRQFWRIKAFS